MCRKPLWFCCSCCVFTINVYILCRPKKLFKGDFEDLQKGPKRAIVETADDDGGRMTTATVATVADVTSTTLRYSICVYTLDG